MTQIKRGDVVKINLGEKTGSVQHGIRPAVVIQNDKGNLNAPTIIVAPITSADKPQYHPTHVSLNRCAFLDFHSMVLTEQITTIDKADIIKKLGHLDSIAMWSIDDAIRISLQI